jgi:DNA-binding NtrC family response regulator
MEHHEPARPVRRSPESAGLIFIVDDDALLGKYAGVVLQKDGYTVKTFTDPKDVLKAMELAETKPRALVTDYEMGEMNGMELIVSSLKIHPSLKTVLISGTVDDTFAANHPVKVDGFIGKPYKPAQLSTMMSQVLRA